jgi:hypothetical protein
MNTKNLAVLLAIFSGFVLFGLTIGCSKNSNPLPPVHDTTTVFKHDTTRLTDTVVQKLDTPDLKTGLVIYLPLNGSMADSSGLNNPVTAVNGASLGYDMHGYAQSALMDNGNGQYLQVPNNGSYTLDTAFSISLDFMIRTAPAWNGVGVPGLESLVSFVNTANGYGPTFHVVLGPTNEPQYLYLGVENSTNTCSNYGSLAATLFDTTSFAPQVGAWYNCIITFTSGTVKVYVNGILNSSATAAFQHVSFCPGASFVVGGWWSGDPESINGEIDEVRLYNRTLNAKQISWLSRNFQANSISTKQTTVPGTGKGVRLN